MRTKEHYEQLWNNERQLSWLDPTTGKRKRLLQIALRRFGGNRPDPSRALDAGCGNGAFVEFFVSLGFETYGMDLSENVATHVRQRCPTATIRSGSLEEPLPFPPAHFDIVWSSEVLEHLFDVQAALSEFGRVTKDGGLLILTTPYHGLVKNALITLRGFDRHFEVTGPHLRFFSQRSLRACLIKAGLRPLWWTGAGRCWPVYKSFFVVARKEAIHTR